MSEAFTAKVLLEPLPICAEKSMSPAPSRLISVTFGIRLLLILPPSPESLRFWPNATMEPFGFVTSRLRVVWLNSVTSLPALFLSVTLVASTTWPSPSFVKSKVDCPVYAFANLIYLYSLGLTCFWCSGQSEVGNAGAIPEIPCSGFSHCRFAVE